MEESKAEESCRLAVHIAENGRTIELDCDASTAIHTINGRIEAASGIPSADQLLLCGDAKLDPGRPLYAYKTSLDGSGREVFVYNRPRLHQDAPPPPPERLGPAAEPAEPPAPSPARNPHPLDDAPDPAVKALPSYERQFRHHYHRGAAVYEATQARLAACERLLGEEIVQDRAVEAAKKSMEHYYRLVDQTYVDFARCYSHQHRLHSEILGGFGRDLERLRAGKLHPSLQSEGKRCLLDLLKEEHLRKWAESCGASHLQFESKVTQLKSMFAELRRRVEDLYSNRASAGIRELEVAIREHRKYVDEQKIIMQSLSKDVTTVKKLVDDCLNSQLSASLRPHDAVSALGPMYDLHDKNHLPKMQACYRAITKLLNFCQARKNEMNLFVHNSMQKVAFVQHMVKDIRLQFPAFKEAMARQDDIFEDLKLVRGVGPAYRACLAETVRRKASMKLYMGMAGQLAERLAMKREAEARRREEFNRTQSAFIPRDILSAMGLFDSPSHCDVNVAPFDLNLLDIDIADVDRYAPENLFGLASKTEKRDSQAGSSSMSNSSHLTEAEENSFGTLDELDNDEFLKGSASVEIAGTSKIEVENAQLKAELASALARLCCLSPEIDYACLDDSKVENILKDTAQKTQEALKLKDEHREQLESLLRTKQMQCESYEKRIRELEMKLQNEYMQGQKGSGSQHTSNIIFSTSKTDDCKSEIYGDREGPMVGAMSEPMDEVSCTSAPLLPVLSLPKMHEGIDENMTDSLAVSCNPRVDSARSIMDASMQDPQRDEAQLGDKIGEEKAGGSLILTSHGTVVDPNLASKPQEDVVIELEKALQEKSIECTKTEIKLKAAMEEVDNLRREIETSQKLLEESQMNCAHLENCLHEAREEAHTNLCAANRRASEYSALRASAVKVRGLLERLRSCVTAPGGVAGCVEPLCALALSIGSSVNENEDDVYTEFRKCIRILADRVSYLSRQRAEQMERCSRVEAAHGRLAQELEEKKEVVKSLYAKHQLEKQANKERISFGRFEVHELAAFVLNSSGHYEAINRNCTNYYLSAESVALFADHLPVRPTYIIGQIVHIERKIVRTQLLPYEQMDDLNSDAGVIPPGSLSNPYNLPVGCVYFIVTVAMLPDTIHSSPS